MMIVILGPDGAGKSSVIEGLKQELSKTFKHIEQFHLKPPIGPFGKTDFNQAPVTTPHGKKPYSIPLSILKIAYMFIWYWIGYLIHANKNRHPESLVIFDRYFHDLLIDPCRFRYGGPTWLALWVSKYIPKPHLFFLLDAPPEILQSRKQEVSFEETSRQREAYLNFIQNVNGLTINASQPLELVIDEALHSIQSLKPLVTK